MKVIGVCTSDFSVYYDLVGALKERGMPFVSLVKGDEIPSHVGVILTSPAEVEDIRHPDVFGCLDPLDCVETANRILAGQRAVRRVVIGIDPGERPGVAVLGDGRTLTTAQVNVPEAAAGVVERLLGTLDAQEYVVRIGNGAPTQRDRILRSLLPLGIPVELVDERSSTPSSYKTNAERDITAAKAIALARGEIVEEVGEIRPSDGELRDIQRKSRIASGDITISRDLAWGVATGELSLDEAIESQKTKRRAASL